MREEIIGRLLYWFASAVPWLLIVGVVVLLGFLVWLKIRDKD